MKCVILQLSKIDLTDVGERALVAEIRNLESDASESDKNDIDRELRVIFLSDTSDFAIEIFNRLKYKWYSNYPRHVYYMKKNLVYLLTFLQYPESIRR